MAKPKKNEVEYTVEELNESKDFPLRTRTIRKYIKEGLLKVRRYYTCKKIVITESSIKEFLKKYKEIKKKHNKSK